MDPRSPTYPPNRSRLPRTRGDGPSAGTPVRGSGGASPHTRGWTRQVARLDELHQGFPAHAGMDPARESRRSERTRLPRTRGDGPATTPSGSDLPAASPHTRGWTLLTGAFDDDDVGFPAHAGMDPTAITGVRYAPGLPRTRGDGPYRDLQAQTHAAASPHTRGWTRTPCHVRNRPAGFPAHAGMDPIPSPVCVSRSRLPRTRGDGPGSGKDWESNRAASPHTRGWTPPDDGDECDICGFPAHAGMDRLRAAWVGAWRRLPRTRGDGPPPSARSRIDREASPHTRGWTASPREGEECAVGFPAHAGMDHRRARAQRVPRRLPRTRGDGPCISQLCNGPEEASPHTRGWTHDALHRTARAGGFPAHAGMDPSWRGPARRPRWLPRTRGDGPCAAAVKRAPGRASPHTRGWTRRIALRARRADGFPAHAGMDHVLVAVRPVGRGLPRTRGDGPTVAVKIEHAASASPHTRGWTRPRRPPRPPLPGFPAHAGMDPSTRWR